MGEQQKPIAYQKNTVAREDLPLPIVFYPEHYGAFFAFQKDESSPITFCSCAKEAIENHIKLAEQEAQTRGHVDSNPYTTLHYFPNRLRHPTFAHQICHECNNATPLHRYCHEMYGGAFKQNYGWYINKQAYEWGIDLGSLLFLPEACPEEMQHWLIEASQTRDSYASIPQTDIERRREVEKKMQKQKKRIENFVENEVRLKFGHKKIGEAWTSETILYYIVKDIFPTKTVLRHYRPDILEGLELDIFIQEFNTGIEYQGIQHFKPIKHWGGKKSYENLRERDKKKQEICKRLAIHLVHFDYNEPLSNDFVRTRIDNAL